MHFFIYLQKHHYKYKKTHTDKRLLNLTSL